MTRREKPIKSVNQPGLMSKKLQAAARLFPEGLPGAVTIPSTTLARQRVPSKSVMIARVFPMGPY